MPTKDSITEIWKAIPGYEGIYEVSSLGRLRRISTWLCGPKKTTPHSLSEVAKAPANKKGYHRVKLAKDGRKKNFGVHALVASAFIGPCPEGFHPNHKDGNKSNNTPENLEYLTPLGNTRHAWANGLCHAYGQKHYLSKLSDEKVLEIRTLLGKGASLKSVAKKFGVAKSAILAIKKGRTWKHLLPK